jgi:hypothetical protein
MTRSRFMPAAFAAGAVLFASGCQEGPSPTSPELNPAFGLGSAQGSELPSAADLDRQVPGFGGFFLDASGAPTIYLKKGSDRGKAEKALEKFLGGKGGAAALKVREAKHAWKDLERWKGDVTSAAFDAAGGVFVDNDETSNLVRVGVEDLNSMGRVRSAAAQLGIPDDALIVEQAEPILQLATLQNVTDRPVQAGVQINFPGFLCSVGFNAVSGGEASFVTASHCTNTQGGTEGTPYWQPLQSVVPTQLATEVDDPGYVRGTGKNSPCPKSRRCRYSDASRAAYVDAGNMALGQIAATSGPNNGSLTITGLFSITSDDCGTTGGCLAVGNTVNKVGRTTGWTSGNITNTCVDTGVSGSNIVQLCQTFVSAGVGGGDSGSDVFQITGGSNVKLAGVLWGGNGAGTQFVFSPFGNVTRELGALTTH